MPAKKSIAPPLGSPVLVTWNDAWASMADISTDSATDHTPMVMEDVGFLISSTKEGVTLCSSKSPEKEGARFIQFIPAGMIVSLKKLK
jgi:hypothetical protein